MSEDTSWVFRAIDDADDARRLPVVYHPPVPERSQPGFKFQLRHAFLALAIFFLAFGWFSRPLAHALMDCRLTTIEEAIHCVDPTPDLKPGDRVVRDRGTYRIGYMADGAVFLTGDSDAAMNRAFNISPNEMIPVETLDGEVAGQVPSWASWLWNGDAALWLAITAFVLSLGFSADLRRSSGR